MVACGGGCRVNYVRETTLQTPESRPDQVRLPRHEIVQPLMFFFQLLWMSRGCDVRCSASCSYSQGVSSLLSSSLLNWSSSLDEPFDKALD